MIVELSSWRISSQESIPLATSCLYLNINTFLANTIPVPMPWYEALLLIVCFVEKNYGLDLEV
jgi:hypothetical protein